MQLPDLPPDIVFVPLSVAEVEDIRFSYTAKKAALGPYVKERWGWDDAYQSDVHLNYLRKRPFLRIVHEGESVGTVSVMVEDDAIQFNEFYLFPVFQKRGIGTRVLRHVLNLADEAAMPVRLQHLKWNPVGTLYRREGFRVLNETEFHWRMERSAIPAEDPSDGGRHRDTASAGYELPER